MTDAERAAKQAEKDEARARYYEDLSARALGIFPYSEQAGMRAAIRAVAKSAREVASITNPAKSVNPSFTEGDAFKKQYTPMERLARQAEARATKLWEERNVETMARKASGLHLLPEPDDEKAAWEEAGAARRVVTEEQWVAWACAQLDAAAEISLALKLALIGAAESIGTWQEKATLWEEVRKMAYRAKGRECEKGVFDLTKETAVILQWRAQKAINEALEHQPLLGAYHDAQVAVKE